MLSENLSIYVSQFLVFFPELKNKLPWQIPGAIASLITEKIKQLEPPHYKIYDGVAIHTNAQMEEHAIIKAPAIISAGCFIAAHTYLRSGVWLGDKVIVGPGCEIKSSLVFASSALAHFNYVGDSIIGGHVNMEAGSVIANHYNERTNKTIYVQSGGVSISTGINKFGALVGDHSKIGANAVLCPGTVLSTGSVVNRLELIEQNPG